MADVEFTLDDMINTAAEKKPTEFNAMFDAAMADKISDKIELARMSVVNQLNGVEPEESEEVEADAEADDETETDDNEEVESDEDDERIHDGEDPDED